MSTHDCPLCPETYEARTDLHVHLEVTHRKSEIVSYLVDAAVDDEADAFEDEPPTPPA